MRQGINPTVIGFTTGHKALQRAGVQALSVEALLNPIEDQPYLSAVLPFLGEHNHPDVSLRESQIYYALGLRDLVELYGWDKAMQRLHAEGRKAFEPTGVMKRYLRRFQPDIVIATTSPRFELALLKAARALAIPSLAVGDLFLVKEREWIARPDYAEHLAVLNSDVADAIAEAGYPRQNIVITGNPAFDPLARRSGDEARRRELRQALGVTDKTVILWPAPGSHVSMIGRPFISPQDVVATFERLCALDQSFTYIYRAHPNETRALPAAMQFGYMDAGNFSAEDVLLVADVVCVEASTMGLQAAIRGLPVICVGYADYVVYPNFGLARGVETIGEAAELVARREYQPPLPAHIPPVGDSTERVLRHVESILRSQT